MKVFLSLHLVGLIFLTGLAGCGSQADGAEKSVLPEATPTMTSTPEDVLPSATPAPTQVDSPWKVVRKIEPISFAATVVGFFDESLGYTAGYAGEVHYTTDGGETWPEGENASMCRFGMDILDAQTAWTIGNGGNVRVTHDGGRTWTPLADVPTGLSQFISMADETAGWAASATRLAATGDGGETWTEIAPPPGIQSIAALSLRTPDEGYLLDQRGMLFVTHDGGKEWRAKGLGLDEPISAPPRLPMGAVRFTDSDHGVVVVALADSGATMIALRTGDGGDTWTREALPEKTGVLFLARDASLLTVFSMDNHITLLRYQGDGG
jgi:photosystem II stability/assembly factor-like uncharacterized protein